MSLPCIHIYADAKGESHFGDTTIDMTSVDFAPPAPAVDLSEIRDAGFGFVQAPVGWFGDWHPAPRKQIMCILSGSLEVQVSDGEHRTIVSGNIVLVEDTTGKGHVTRALGHEPVLMTVAQVD